MKRSEAFLGSVQGVRDGDPVPSACARVVEFIVSHHSQLSEILSFRQVAEISQLPADSSDFMRVVALFTNASILEWQFTYFPDDGREPFYLSKEASRRFLLTHEFDDPDHGVTIEAASDKVYPYFRADADFLQSDVEQ